MHENQGVKGVVFLSEFIMGRHRSLARVEMTDPTIDPCLALSRSLPFVPITHPVCLSVAVTIRRRLSKEGATLTSLSTTLHIDVGIRMSPCHSATYSSVTPSGPCLGQCPCIAPYPNILTYFSVYSVFESFEDNAARE